jgi:hypothetical protein
VIVFPRRAHSQSQGFAFRVSQEHLYLLCETQFITVLSFLAT